MKRKTISLQSYIEPDDPLLAALKQIAAERRASEATTILQLLAESPAVRAILDAAPICQGCGKPLPRSTSPYFIGDGQDTYLCPECAEPGAV